MNGASSGLSSWVKDTSSCPQPHHFIAAMAPHYLRGSAAHPPRLDPPARARGAARARRRAAVRADRSLGRWRRAGGLGAGRGWPVPARTRSPCLDSTRIEGPGVHGGWVGWLGYRLGARVEQLDPAPPRPRPLADFQLAFYDHLLRMDAEGRWWFECLWTPERADALAAREAELRARVAEPRPFSTGPWSSVPGTGGHELAVAAARERIHAGDLFQANVCLRLQSKLEGDPLDLFAAGVEALAPDRAAFVERNGGQPLARAVPGAPRPAACAPRPSRAPAALVATRAELEALGQGPGREHDDRGPDAQRPGPGVRARQRRAWTPWRRRAPHAGVWHLVSEVSGRLRDGRRRRRPAARLLPARVRDRGAEDRRAERDRRAGVHRPRGLHGRHRLRLPRGRAGAQRGHQDVRVRGPGRVAGRGRRRGGRLRPGRRGARVRGQGRAAAGGDRESTRVCSAQRGKPATDRARRAPSRPRGPIPRPACSPPLPFATAWPWPRRTPTWPAWAPASPSSTAPRLPADTRRAGRGRRRGPRGPGPHARGIRAR